MGKAGGVLIIIAVIGFIGLYMAMAEDQKIQDSFKEKLETISKEFGQGEKITFYMPPTFTDDEVASLNAERAFNSFAEGVEQFEKIIVSTLSSSELKSIVNGLPEGSFKNYVLSLNDNELREYIDEVQNKNPEDLTTQEKSLLQGVQSVRYETDPNKPIYEQEIVSGITVINRGEIVKIFGVIEKRTPPPYFYNVEVTCCDMTEILQKTNIQTDADGSFAYNFATTTKHPLGLYEATVITLSEDLRNLIEYSYKFQVIE